MSPETCPLPAPGVPPSHEVHLCVRSEELSGTIKRTVAQQESMSSETNCFDIACRTMNAHLHPNQEEAVIQDVCIVLQTNSTRLNRILQI